MARLRVICAAAVLVAAILPFTKASAAYAPPVAGTWTWQEATPTGETVNGMSCPSGNYCYAAADYGTILVSHPGGQAWTPQSSGTHADLLAMSCPSDTTCYATGKNATILVTTDGGATWVKHTSAAAADLVSVSCPNTTTCFVLATSLGCFSGCSSSVETTTDGGATWRLLPSAPAAGGLTSIACPATTTTCVLVGSGGSVFVSANSGLTWGGQNAVTKVNFGGVSCGVATTTSCAAVGTNPSNIMQTFATVATTNDISSGIWSYHDYSWNTVGGLSAVSCAPAVCFAVGINGAIVTGGTSNPTWAVQTGPTKKGLYAISCLGTTVGSTPCIGGGDWGMLVGTATGLDNSWVTQSQTAVDGPYGLNSISCPTSSDCFAVGGAYGYYNIVENGGGGWGKRTISTPISGRPGVNSLIGVSCASGTKSCVAVGSGGVIVTTVDGVNWNVSFKTVCNPTCSYQQWTTNQLNSVACMSNTNCLAVGNSGTILATSDGGTTWITQNSKTTAGLLSITCPSAGICYVGGGVLLATTDGGSNWSTSTTTPAKTVNGVACITTSTCFAAGDGGMVLETTDSGSTWPSLNSGTQKGLNGIACPAVTRCFAVGAAGTIIANGGSAGWFGMGSPTGYSLGGIACTSANNCLAVGTGGAILGFTANLVALSPARLDFGSQAQGSQSGVQVVTLTNYGPPLTISSVGFSGANAADFNLTNYCPMSPSTLATGANCAITVTLTPGAVGLRTAQLSVLDNAPDATQSIPLVGTGTPPAGSMAESWKWSNPQPQGETVNGISCPSVTVCFVAGDHGTLLATSDGGATWKPQASGITNQVRGISCPSTSVCFAVSSGPTLTTTNGGATWSTLGALTAPSGYGAISCPSATTCLAVGTYVLVTTDGGATWSNHNAGGYGYNSISCPSPTTCFVVDNNTVYSTTNVGGSWTSAKPGNSTFLAISCATTSACAIVGTAYANFYNGVVDVTNDGGTTWTTYGFPASSVGGVNAVSCASATVCYGAGDAGALIEGDTSNPVWGVQTSPVSRQQRAISCPSATVCVAGGRYGDLFGTANGGAAWTRIGGTGVSQEYGLNDISCPTANTCFADGGGYGYYNATSTVNGGAWWSALSVNGVGYSLIGAGCGSASSCVLVGNSGTIAVTADGTYWQTVSSPTSSDLFGVTCSASGTCFALGRNGTLLASTDGGFTWATRDPKTTISLVRASCPSASVCVAVGYGGTITTTVNGGTTWATQASGTSSDLRGVSCPTAALCYAVGTGGTIIETGNGGSSWSSQTSGTANDLDGVACPSVSLCFATGKAGTILTSTGNGIWTSMPSPTDLELGNVSCPTTLSCYAAGQNGAIVAYSAAPAAGLSQSAISFGSQGTGSTSPASSVRVTDTGYAPLHIGLLSLGGANAGDFAISSDQCSGATLAPATHCDVGLTFSPGTLGSRSGLLSIPDDAADSPQAVSLSGTGITVPGVPTAVSGLGGNATAQLTWTAPSSTGGSAITAYRVTPYISGTAQTPIMFNSTATTQTVTGLTPGTTYTFTVAAINAAGTGPESAPSNAVAVAGVNPGVYRPVTPFRILDTRQCAPCGAPIGPYSTPFTSDTTRTLQVTGAGTIPSSGVSAVVLNVTATDTSQGGFFTIYPHGAARPNASNVNFVAGQTVPNLVEVAVGGQGMVDLYNYYGSADMIIDVAGYFATGGGSSGLFNPVPPARIMDTRQCAPCGAPIGPYGTPFGSGQTRTLTVAGAALGGVPAGASGVVLNVTVTSPSNDGFLTLYPDGASRPNASNVNFVAGQTVPNRVYVKLGSNGSVDVFNFNSTTDVIIDVNGYFSDGSAITTGYQYYPLAPVRIIDTRQCAPCGAPIGPYSSPLGAGQVNVVSAAGSGGVPPAPGAAQALVANVTATDTTQGSFYTLYPNGGSRPNASDLNWVAGETVPNLSVTKLGSDGNLEVFNYYGNADLIIDVNGYYGP